MNDLSEPMANARENTAHRRSRLRAVSRILVLAFGLTGLCAAGDTLSLAGRWDFRLDPGNKGIEQTWWKQTFPDRITLPGFLQAQGFGEKPGPKTRFVLGEMIKEGASLGRDSVYDKYRTKENYKSSEILEPLRHYVGPAWYSRIVEIPAAWEGKRVTMELERCHWETRVWVDDHAAGRADGIGVPHYYDLSKWLAPGRHRLTIRVTNEMVVPIGVSAHSISDQTQTCWNGILGRMALTATDPVWIDDVQVFPDLAQKEALVRVTIGNATGMAGRATLTLDAMGFNAGNTHDPAAKRYEVRVAEAQRTRVELRYPMGKEMRLWDEFEPALYRMHVGMAANVGGRTNRHAFATRFGMREFGIDGKHFTINGHRIFLRGNVDCAVFPFTGHPPLDVAAWKRIWKTYKDFGLNHARFHSWCPPEAAFAAADEIGIYLAPEASEWVSVLYRAQEEFFQRESAAMLRDYGNHPSFVMMGLGNERGGKKEILARLVEGWKKADPRRRYTAKAACRGNPPGTEYEFEGCVAGQRIRYQMGWPPRPASSLFLTRPPQTTIDWRVPVSKIGKPVIAHEIGQICSYPDVPGGIAKFTGFLRPTYLEIARDQLKERGMLDLVPRMVEASGLWQIELTKEEMEAQFRTPEMFSSTPRTRCSRSSPPTPTSTGSGGSCSRNAGR